MKKLYCVTFSKQDGDSYNCWEMVVASSEDLAIKETKSNLASSWSLTKKELEEEITIEDCYLIDQIGVYNIFLKKENKKMKFTEVISNLNQLEGGFHLCYVEIKDTIAKLKEYNKELKLRLKVMEDQK